MKHVRFGILFALYGATIAGLLVSCRDSSAKHPKTMGVFSLKINFPKPSPLGTGLVPGSPYRSAPPCFIDNSDANCRVKYCLIDTSWVQANCDPPECCEETTPLDMTEDGRVLIPMGPGKHALRFESDGHGWSWNAQAPPKSQVDTSIYISPSDTVAMSIFLIPPKP